MYKGACKTNGKCTYISDNVGFIPLRTVKLTFDGHLVCKMRLQSNDDEGSLEVPQKLSSKSLD